MIPSNFYFIVDSTDEDETTFGFIEKSYWEGTGDLNQRLPRNFKTILPHDENTRFRISSENFFTYENNDLENACPIEAEQKLNESGFTKLEFDFSDDDAE